MKYTYYISILVTNVYLHGNSYSTHLDVVTIAMISMTNGLAQFDLFSLQRVHMAITSTTLLPTQID